MDYGAFADNAIQEKAKKEKRRSFNPNPVSQRMLASHGTVRYDSMGSSEEALQHLWVELLHNHITNSFGVFEQPTVDVTQFLSKKGTMHMKRADKTSLPFSHNNRVRNILVVGAGASHDAYSTIPLGNKMLERFDAEYVNQILSIPFLKDKYNTHKKEIEQLSAYSFDFENSLSLLSEHFVTQPAIRNSIAQSSGFRHLPSLFYEICAHLLKHSYVDAIINFNFDELLDQAILEEIQRSNYKFVLSDGDCSSLDEMLVDGRMKMPLYIKPHGTYTHESSLRFTKRHYLEVPEDIQRIILQLVKGYRGDTPGRKPFDRINLIVVGFNMLSLEFNQMLDELPAKANIYHFGYEVADYKGAALPFLLPRYCARLKETGRTVQDAYRYIPTEFAKEWATERSSPYGPLGTMWRDLYGHIEESFSANYKPRSINRHALLSLLFEDEHELIEYKRATADLTAPELLRYHRDNSPKYFRDRVMFELLLGLLRGEGLIDIPELMGEERRLGQFYKMYTDGCAQFPKTIKGHHSVYELLADLSMSDVPGCGGSYIYGRNLFRLDFSNITGQWKKWELRFRKNWEDTVRTSGSSTVSWHVRMDELVARVSEVLLAVGSTPQTAWKGLLVGMFLASESISSSTRRRLMLKLINEKRPEDAKAYSDELKRTLSGVGGKAYYYIQPRYNDPQNHIWEEYSRSRAMHTNLSLRHSFYDLFVDRDWSHLMAILETHEQIINAVRFARDLGRKGGTVIEDIKSARRSLYLCCCREAVAQHFGMPDANEVKLIARLRAEIRKETEWADQQVHVSLLPYNEHNHHMILFVKKSRMTERGSLSKVDPLEPYPEIRVLPKAPATPFALFNTGAMYMYRRGLSAAINPVYIGPTYTDVPTIAKRKERNDFDKLLRIFLAYWSKKKARSQTEQQFMHALNNLFALRRNK